MNDELFDRIGRSLVGASSRRRVLKLVGGLTVGAVALGAETAAKPDQGNGNGTGNGKGKGKREIRICHQTGSGRYKLLKVSASAAKGHGHHEGDVFCPTDDPCNTFQSCDQTTGACVPTPANDGDECTVDDTAGTCQSGACVANPIS